MYEDLIKRLRDKSIFFGQIEIFDQMQELLLEAADAIEELSRLHEAQRQNLITLMNEYPETEWIPVTERLPEKEDEAVIVWETQGFALIDWRHDNKWVILDNNYGIATHWMPLPQAPKEET